MGDPSSSHCGYQNSFFDIDPSLIDLSNFSRYDADDIPANTSSIVPANRVDGHPINELISSDGENTWQGVQHDVYFDQSSTYFEGDEILNPISIDASFSEWLDLSVIDAGFSLPEMNRSPNAILQHCGLGSLEPGCEDLSTPNILFPTPANRIYPPQPIYSKRQNIHHNSDVLKVVEIQGVQSPSRPIPKFDDLTYNFNINPKPPLSKRQRSAFTRAGKEKVRLVRDWGACVFCRSRKVSVSDASPCS